MWALPAVGLHFRYVDKISKQIAGTVSDILSKKDEKKSQDVSVLVVAASATGMS